MLHDNLSRIHHPIKPILKQHGITIGTVARYLGKNYYYVQKILNGDIRPTLEIAGKLDSLFAQLTGKEVQR